jgi:protein TonB
LSTKTLVLLLVGVMFFGLVVCGGGAAFWYFKFYRGATPDVGPLAGEALSLPADTAVVVGLNLKALFASATFKQIVSGDVPGAAAAQSPDEAQGVKTQVREAIEKGMKEAEDKVGIRPDRDLDRLIVAGANVGAATPEVVAFLLGRFDRPRITRALEAAAKGEKAVLTSKTVEGVPVLVMAGEGAPGAELAFLDDSTLVLGTLKGVDSVLANRARGARPLEGNVSLMGLVKGIEPASGYWLAVDQSVAGRIEKEAGGASPVPLPRTLTLAGSFDGGIALSAQMADAAAAQALVETLDQGLEMVRQQAAQNPEVQKLPGAQELLAGIKARAEGQTVRLTVPGGGAGTALGGMLAAVAIPSLLRARVSANESAAIGDIRMVISAQATFAAIGNGSYGDLTCLAEPKSCIAGYEGPPFLDAFFSATERSGYRRAFHPGPSAGVAKHHQSYAYTAVPLSSGQTGVRSFCGDASGLVCFEATGAEIVPQAGACPQSCLPLDGAPRPPAVSESAAPPPPRAPSPARTPAARRTSSPVPPPTLEAEAPPAAPEPAAPAEAVRVGGSIKEPRKLKNVAPIYPQTARQARVQGVVILECRIGTEGKVTDVKVLRGIPLLDGSATEAVRRWEYEPTLLNGVPVPVIMTVTVNFRLN